VSAASIWLERYRKRCAAFTTKRARNITRRPRRRLRDPFAACDAARVRGVFCLIGVLFLEGCRLLGDGVPCVGNDNCPLGYSCRATVCVVQTDDAGSARDGGTQRDAGATDAGDTDAGATDAGATDAGDADAGPTDAGAADAGPDAGPGLNGPLVLYTFDEGAGAVIRDTAGRGEPLDLTLEDTAPVSWVAGAIDVTAAARARSGAPATKLIDACVASSSLTVESWVVPVADNVSGPARIITLSLDGAVRNFTLAVDNLDWRFRIDSVDNDAAGRDYREISAPGGVVPGELRHVLAAYDEVDGFRFYVDATLITTRPSDGALTTWDTSYELGLFNELNAERPWTGRMVQSAVWCRALSGPEIVDRFNAGPSSGT
jgi:hypothetical protein